GSSRRAETRVHSRAEPLLPVKTESFDAWKTLGSCGYHAVGRSIVDDDDGTVHSRWALQRLADGCQAALKKIDARMGGNQNGQRRRVMGHKRGWFCLLGLHAGT